MLSHYYWNSCKNKTIAEVKNEFIRRNFWVKNVTVGAIFIFFWRISSSFAFFYTFTLFARNLVIWWAAGPNHLNYVAPLLRKENENSRGQSIFCFLCSSILIFFRLLKKMAFLKFLQWNSVSSWPTFAQFIWSVPSGSHGAFSTNFNSSRPFAKAPKISTVKNENGSLKKDFIQRSLN